ncbi:hypothetical protein [Marinobacter sp. CHS3-4]|uniref:hypothetical protein n=1 Tax=Marinobacter sp. CHS3-4 TaxID=3045174 RepID=UPI0024B595A0|nr:hypothetical protein [Marinobacter sp. CHS3-4]MDI9243741.1 hypothetical protein [Marinobacter sp. CHS3-4]
MTTAESMDQNNENDNVSPEQVKRGRRTALLLFAIGFGPMVLATVMYYTGWLNPTGNSNHGELLQPPAPVSQLQMQGADGSPLEDRFGPELKEPEWLMIVVSANCGSECEDLLYRTRQVNIALGKNANRVNRSAWLGSMSDDLAQRWSSEYAATEQLSLSGIGEPSWPAGVDPVQQPRILVVDPFGNVVLHYGSEHTGKQMLSDLKHLLKLSQIG